MLLSPPGCRPPPFCKPRLETPLGAAHAVTAAASVAATTIATRSNNEKRRNMFPPSIGGVLSPACYATVGKCRKNKVNCKLACNTKETENSEKGYSWQLGSTQGVLLNCASMQCRSRRAAGPFRSPVLPVCSYTLSNSPTCFCPESSA